VSQKLAVHITLLFLLKIITIFHFVVSISYFKHCLFLSAILYFNLVLIDQFSSLLQLFNCAGAQWACWVSLGYTSLGLGWAGSALFSTRASPLQACTSPAARFQPQLQALFQSFGNITQVKSVLLGAIDRKQRDLMRSTVNKLLPQQTSLWKTSSNECFALRACLVNVFTRPHVDSSDMDWAMLGPIGNFGGGQFCIADLRRSFSYPAGSIGGIRGRHLVHFTRMWQGSRTCLVSTMHASLLP